jgi:hypothetical protein
MTATIPWKNILSEHCKLKIDGLELVLAPKAEEQCRSALSFSLSFSVA